MQATATEAHTANMQIDRHFQRFFNEAITSHTRLPWGLATPHAHVTG